MEEAVAHRGFRLAFQTKNIHTAAMILLLVIGMRGAEDSVTRIDQGLRFNLEWKNRTLSLFTQAA
jgi:hypothetical protein